ncbi:MAG: hypothetical protein WCO86_02715 [Planctomycetota bacterium]
MRQAKESVVRGVLKSFLCLPKAVFEYCGCKAGSYAEASVCIIHTAFHRAIWRASKSRQ